MRVLIRFLVIGLGVILLVAGTALFWIRFYSRDLPDMRALAQFAPSRVRHVSDPCIAAASVAIPYASIGNPLKAALSAAEAREDDKAKLSLQISRSMFCAPSKTLNREVAEYRVAEQLKRRFSQQELFTIFANRTWFGEGQVGVEAAAQHFFQKEPDQLQVGEAALLAGMIRGLSRLSPYSHPDRALQRRNEVIDAMVESHAIDVKQGEVAKSSALGVVERRGL
jgi:membrane carboxypeptidase/penicillin-binding protein